MRRYLLFAGQLYYPRGGWNDFAGSFGALDEAKAAASRFLEDNYGWVQAIDSETQARVLDMDSREEAG